VAGSGGKTSMTETDTRGFARPLAVLAALAAALLVAAAAGWLAYVRSFERALDETRDAAGHRLDLYIASFEREVGKFATFPFVISLDQHIASLVSAPGDPGLAAPADIYLEKLNARIGTLAVFVLDKAGRCIASSNWDKPYSYVGRDLSYRPYYRNTSIDQIERFYGIGTTDKEPGYYLATALYDGETILGTGVVKVGLEQLERSWFPAGAPVLVSDEHGVVVLSSTPAWKYKTLRPLSEAERAGIAETQQYNDRTLAPLGMTVIRTLDDANGIVTLADPPADTASDAAPGPFLAQTRPMPGTPLHLTLLSDLRQNASFARNRAALAALATLFVLGALASLIQRQRYVWELVSARAALQGAYDGLEQTVSERTSELVLANAHLQEEVKERVRAERTLREAQAGLVHAGKLAVLGQLSAGIVHELNQPLAALAALSGNTVKFLERGDTGTAKTNLDRIRPLIDRMGRLTGELKTFARKSSGEAQLVPVRRAIDSALFLLHHRIERGAVAVCEDIEEDATVWCDPNHFEQVLLNLIGNALDAMDGRASRQLTFVAHQQGEQTQIEIRDNGPGLPEELFLHLFEPFVTTKAAGAGLGLGLAISAGIIREAGGEIAAENAGNGGARFVIKLPACKEGTP
jgi:C4-dicarboxylate-specific signal transduction histidine kinase